MDNILGYAIYAMIAFAVLAVINVVAPILIPLIAMIGVFGLLTWAIVSAARALEHWMERNRQSEHRREDDA